MMKNFVCFMGVLGLTATLAATVEPAKAATWQNGDFSDGTNGYDVRRCSFICAPDGTNSSEVVTGAGANPYLELRAPSYIFGAGQIEAIQSVEIDATASQLSFDASLLSTSNDILRGSVPSSLPDYFTLLLQTSSNFYSLFTYDVAGAREAASNVLTDILSITPTSLPNMSGAVSAYNFGADLSQFAGETVSLFFVVVSKDDEAVTRFGIDNISLTGGSVSEVPLPAGAWLVLTALGALAGARRLGTRSSRI